MKKTILFAAALLLGLTAMNAEEVIISEITATWGTHNPADPADAENQTDPGKYGFTDGTSHDTIALDDYITIMCENTTGTNGTWYKSAKAAGDWRIYQARGPQLTIKAAEPAKITGVMFDYYANQAKGGGVLSYTPGDNLTDTIASLDMQSFEKVAEVVMYAATSEGTSKAGAAQVRIQRVVITYDLPETGLKNVATEKKAKKIIRDGQLFIVRGDEEFNVLGF